MLVVPELEKEVKLLWESRDTRKVLINFITSIIIYTNRKKRTILIHAYNL